MIHVLYHGNCPDGTMAAAIASRYFTRDIDPNYSIALRFVPCLYGEPLSDYLPVFHPGGNDQVYILDFSFPRDQLVELKSKVASLVVLDHHKSAQADLAGLDFCEFDMERSGAMMAWDRFYPERRAPDIVAYIQDRDLWHWGLDRSREVSAAIGSYPLTIDSFASFLDTPDIVSELMDEGVVCLRLKEQQVEQMAARRRSVMVDPEAKPPAIFPFSAMDELGLVGFLVPCANATCFFSEVGERLCELHPEAEFSLYYFDREDGKRQWGLRSRGDFDCSVVAKAFGGGGHPGAAGFTTDL